MRAAKTAFAYAVFAALGLTIVVGSVLVVVWPWPGRPWWFGLAIVAGSFGFAIAVTAAALWLPDRGRP